MHAPVTYFHIGITFMWVVSLSSIIEIQIQEEQSGLLIEHTPHPQELVEVLVI